MDWHEHVQQVIPHVVRIETPGGYGTGFIRYRQDGWFGIATARHVIADAHKWGQPIKIYQQSSPTPLTLHEGQRAVGLDPQADAAIVVARETDDLAEWPDTPMDLVASTYHLRPGVAVGWLGYPHLIEDGTCCCFFSGSISVYRDHRYFIDGVSIQGVSGGPAFCTVWDQEANDSKLAIIGSVSAYRANRTGGDTLPGVLIAADVSGFHNLDDLTRPLFAPEDHAVGRAGGDPPVAG